MLLYVKVYFYFFLVFDVYVVFVEDLVGLKVWYGLDKVMEGEVIVFILKDLSILVDGDVNDGE